VEEKQVKALQFYRNAICRTPLLTDGSTAAQVDLAVTELREA